MVRRKSKVVSERRRDRQNEGLQHKKLRAIELLCLSGTHREKLKSY